MKSYLELAKKTVSAFITLRKGERVEDREEYAEAVDALGRAINRYDATKDAAIETYLNTAIRNAVFRFIESDRARSKHTKQAFELRRPDHVETHHAEKEAAVRLLLSKFPQKSESQQKDLYVLVESSLKCRRMLDICQELGVSYEIVRRRRNRALETIQRYAASVVRNSELELEKLLSVG